MILSKKVFFSQLYLRICSDSIIIGKLVFIYGEGLKELITQDS